MSVARVWSIVPRTLKSLVLGVLACGWLAPTGAGLWLGAAGTLTAVAMVAGALRFASRPLIDAEGGHSALPAELEAGAVSVMSELAPGAARNLLADIVCLGRDCFQGLKNEPVLVEHVSSLVRVGLDAARELDGLDRALERLGDQRVRLGRVSARWWDDLARCERARDGLVQRLLEASAALGLARGVGMGSTDTVAEQLAELTREIESEVALQAEAAKEVAELLDG